MLAKTISSICHKGHFVVKGLKLLLSANDHHTPRANTRVKCILLSILSKHWGFEVAGHILYFRSAVFVSSSINHADIIDKTSACGSKISYLFIFCQPHHRKKKKKKKCGFQTGPTQTELYKHRSFIEAANFGF